MVFSIDFFLHKIKVYGVNGTTNLASYNILYEVISGGIYIFKV